MRDDRKLLCWIPQNDTAPGATYPRLPKVVGLADPAGALHEQTQRSGVIPMERPGQVLYEEMAEMIGAGEDSLAPVWSGIAGKNPLSCSWKSIAKEGQGKE